jgi:Zn-dependent protease
LKSLITSTNQSDFILILLAHLVAINVILAVFNLLPIPSFDGAHFVTYMALKLRIFKIAEFFAKAEPYGMIVIILILMIPPLKSILILWPFISVLDLLNIIKELSEILHWN